MELSRLSSILAMSGALNIFYALYSLAHREWVYTFILTVTYLILMYSAAIVDAKAEEIRRAKERESAEESDMRLGFD